jgi:uncharacterized membrane protein YhaH (DUF805 family)
LNTFERNLVKPVTQRITLVFVALLALITPTWSVLAHEGHGANGPHWHASDAWMLLALAAGIGVAIWLSKGKK